MTDLQNPIFTNEDAARAALEAVRWPNGPVCPHCEATDRLVKVEGTKKTHRPGLYYCNHCQGQFTATIGTVFERSKIPLSKWWLASHLMGSSKKGISAHQLHRMLGITYKSAWFMAHRLREAMTDTNPSPIGGSGKIIEADESFVGGKEGNKHRIKRKLKGRGYDGKDMVFSLVERGGKARSFHVPSVSVKELRPILFANADPKSALMTDEGHGLSMVDKEFARREMVRHSKGEYVRGDIHTNTVEGFFSIFKRGVMGTYHHVSTQHLKRYLAEFDFRYTNRASVGVNDAERAHRLVKGIIGKRLTYRRIGEGRERA
jgi:transposase-like protein